MVCPIEAVAEMCQMPPIAVGAAASTTTNDIAAGQQIQLYDVSDLEAGAIDVPLLKGYNISWLTNAGLVIQLYNSGIFGANVLGGLFAGTVADIVNQGYPIAKMIVPANWDYHESRYDGIKGTGATDVIQNAETMNNGGQSIPGDLLLPPTVSLVLHSTTASSNNVAGTTLAALCELYLVMYVGWVSMTKAQLERMLLASLIMDTY